MDTQKLLTVDQFYVEETPGRLDLIRGELVVSSYATMGQGLAAGNLVGMLGNYVRDDRLGTAYAGGTGFILGRDPDTVLTPDIAYLRPEHRPPRTGRDEFVNGPPNIAVETISPWDVQHVLQTKLLLYLNAGTPLVWIVEPITATITVFQPNFSGRILRGHDVLDGDEVLPGFRVNVAEIFE